MPLDLKAAVSTLPDPITSGPSLIAVPALKPASLLMLIGKYKPKILPSYLGVSLKWLV